MFNFDQDRYVRIQTGAMNQAEGLHEAIGRALADGADNLIFLGSGGAGILMQPAVQLLQRRSRFAVSLELPAEIVAAGSVRLGPTSLVVIPSLSGTTKESIAALRYSKEQNARVITLVGHAATPLGQEADEAFANFAEDDTSCESFYLQSLLLALSLMHHRGEFDDYDGAVAELRRLPQLLVEAKRAFEPRAEAFAETIRHEGYHIVTGAGNVWPEAFYYGMCILEEMQWIRTRPVHASDFFHGTLELLEKGVSVILFKGEDECRPLAERVEQFAPRYTDRFHVFDTAECELPGISPAVRGLISPAILSALFERVSAHLEHKRDHPLTTRRYYKQVAY
ncbi:SIS domain-containing protein [Aureimonas phyllosphaerae]|uniref:Fructoselysine-6-phosphate deglycase n=1 Tax=Aureimonas phyllosphaerae TaxID=1166078 RepID=A0A7W6FXM2_9HYPH|nr:SIS domain-containing protein [Aureimonas phyllosphaerae]MBB3938267.1 fructoselysine-6-phosphate deglycase [Aureimonas phyllosphaerae]MBB3962274.1 fructoselysine-6-phosphate deglycase [Aureimonas phyllosphaerae]SFF59086.1 fructoselysine-6-phosphate deglycase [Aureimonas phyllosphaerae]